MKKYIFGALTIVSALTLTSCNDYLDKLPDDRAELNSEKKITELLVSSYPTVTNNLIQEMLSDNVDDNGRGYSSPVLCEELYRLQEPTEESDDTPYHVWEGFYHSVAVCNQALQAIEQMGNPKSLLGDKAEAQIVRAYSMFQLANTFCMAWNPEKADEYLGLPYPLEPEQNVKILTRISKRHCPISHWPMLAIVFPSTTSTPRPLTLSLPVSTCTT